MRRNAYASEIGFINVALRARAGPESRCFPATQRQMLAVGLHQFWPSFGRDLHPILTHVYTPILLWGAGDVRSDRRSVTLDFIHRGKPVENGFVESFNGRLRDECLNANQFSPSTRSPDSGNEDNGP